MSNVTTAARVNVCPQKDIECGSNSATWCSDCPKHKGVLNQQNSIVSAQQAGSSPVTVNIGVREDVGWEQMYRSATAEVERLNAIINRPHYDDFIRAVSIEAEHQRQRWRSQHDAGKTPADWFWLIGYLAGKALHSHAAGNTRKTEHHIITTAAACENWHRALLGQTDMRPGIDGAAIMADPD